MIYKHNRTRIRNVLGKPCTKPVSIYLNSIGIFNPKGEPYSVYSISGVLCGHQSSKKLETAIMEFVDRVEELSKPKEEL